VIAALHPQSRADVDIAPHYGLFIDGDFVDPIDGASFKTINPATEEVLASISEAGAADVDRAVRAARSAYKATWSRMPGAERAKYLYRLARIIQERSRELAVLETLDHGKPIRGSLDADVPLAAAHFFYNAGWADKLEHAGFGAKPRPCAVAAVIIPWNSPLLALAGKIAPALATGNTVVLKPAETTPLTALAFADICQQAELPPGVVNIVTGGEQTGRLLVEHPDIDTIAFTGSTQMGESIQRAIGGTRKGLTLQLAGTVANIVFDDAPIDEAVEAIVGGLLVNTGPVPFADLRLVLQDSIHDDVLERLKDRLQTLHLGDPLDKSTDIGAINSAELHARIDEFVRSGDTEDAERWSAPCSIPDRGWWYPPTIFTGVAQAHRIAREEIFGPFLSILTFHAPNEAVEIANDSPYGLAAGVWTREGARALWTASRLRAGTVWANTFNVVDPASPVGGFKESGFGREGGRQGLAAFLRTDVI